MDKKLQDSLLALGFLLVIVLMSWLSFSISLSEEFDIPITGQTFAVLLTAYFLPRNHALIVLSTYLLIGVLGLPVFADGASGVDKILSPSGGFLWSFLLVIFLMDILKKSFKNKEFIDLVVMFITCHVFILLIGNLWLSYFYGIGKALEYGFYPFWPGALIKSILVAAVVFFWRRYKKSDA